MKNSPDKRTPFPISIRFAPELYQRQQPSSTIRDMDSQHIGNIVDEENAARVRLGTDSREVDPF